MRRVINLILVVITLIACSGCFWAVDDDRRGHGDRDRGGHEDRRDHDDRGGHDGRGGPGDHR